MSLITPVKIKHPQLPAFTLFLCLVISIAIIVRHWLPKSEAVSFHLGCCNKYHRPSNMWTAEIYFLTVTGAEKSKIKVNADFITREEPLSGSQEDCFQCTPTCQKRAGALPGLVWKRTPLPWGLWLWLNHIHRPHLLIPSPSRLRFQHMNDSWGLCACSVHDQRSPHLPLFQEVSTHVRCMG